MDNIILALMELIKQNLPELSYIDEYFGQLESDDDTNPVTFPCVLIENPDADWRDIAPGVQSGSVMLTFRLAIDCYDDTHYGSGTEDRLRERYELNNRLYCTLQELSVPENMDSLSRVKSCSYTIGGGIKVYETTYRFDFHDESAQGQIPDRY